MTPGTTLSTTEVLGSTMAYREAGRGPTVLLLHGNPTSSYLWRHLLRRAAAGDDAGHCWIAPDLIGMGSSGKPDIAYRLKDHVDHVDAFIDALGLVDVVLVGHDWGVSIALDRLRRHAGSVRGVAVIEGHLRPLAGWEAFDDGGRSLFQQLRTPGRGEQLALVDNFFLDTLLPAATGDRLSPQDLAAYRAPYPDPASRRPLLQWAREIPVAGSPAETAERMEAAAAHLAETTVPTLLVHGEPGVLVTPDTVAWCREHLANLSISSVGGPAGHFLPEDRPDEVVDALHTWIRRLP